MWLSNALAQIPVSIWYQYVDPPAWTGLAMHGAVAFDYNNVSVPHTPKPAFIAASTLQRELGALPCLGRLPARSASMAAGTLVAILASALAPVTMPSSEADAALGASKAEARTTAARVCAT